MKIEIKPTENPEKLAENLEKRTGSVSVEDEMVVVETDDREVLRRTPGIESFTVQGEEIEGIGGKPVDELAYARLDSRKDAVRAFLATLEGYNLVILDTERTWDLKQLRRYNPDIKHIRQDEPVEKLGIQRSLKGTGSTDEVDLEMPGKSEREKIYREMLT